jgi:senataxin
VKDVALETKVDHILSENSDAGELQNSIIGFRMELQRITTDIVNCRKRIHAIANAAPWPLSRDWEIRIDEESFNETGRVYFVNHSEKTTTFECPPPPEPGETQFPARSMPSYRGLMAQSVKLVENYFNIKSNLEQATIIKGSMGSGASITEVRQNLEMHILNSVHMVMTTLGTSGSRALCEGIDKFEVVVVDEAAQSVEPATLAALQLGSRHCVMVGDPQVRIVFD